MRFLLYPIILSHELVDSRYLKKCAEACGGVCRTYKKLHQVVPVGFSIMALHSVFLAGKHPPIHCNLQMTMLHDNLIADASVLQHFRSHIAVLHLGRTTRSLQYHH